LLPQVYLQREIPEVSTWKPNTFQIVSPGLDGGFGGGGCWNAELGMCKHDVDDEDDDGNTIEMIHRFSDDSGTPLADHDNIASFARGALSD
jgi:hypothetical protein